MKLVKQKWFTRAGEEKINCYKITISKKVVKEVGFTDKDDLIVKAEGNKIIIERK